MGKFDWIKDLARAEQQIEESGMVDFSVGFDADKTLQNDTIHFLEELKENFVEYTSAFNQIKGSAFGNIKVYGISNTYADFMLFRNGFKLIFSLKAPGQVVIRSQHPSGFLPGSMGTEGAALKEDMIEARWGAFSELIWTYQQMPVNMDHTVRYYLSQFIRESAR